MPISRANNNQIKLTKRLAAAADAVREGCRVVDVGCDHGRLAAFLVLSGKCRYALATDISAPSLEKARQLFRECAVEDRAETLLADGLSGVDARYTDDVVIAGLGFDVTAHIIATAPWLQNEQKRLVLVPSSHHERLRRFLYGNGFQILFERAVLDAGHVYTVMSAAWCGVKQEVSPVFAAFGKILDSDGDKDDYIDRESRRCRMLIEEVENARIKDIVKVREARDILAFIEKIKER